MRGKSTERRFFVLPHEAAVAEDIGAEYGGELTFHAPTPEYAPDYSVGRSIISNVVLPSSFVTPVCATGAMVKSALANVMKVPGITA